MHLIGIGLGDMVGVGSYRQSQDCTHNESAKGAYWGIVSWKKYSTGQ